MAQGGKDMYKWYDIKTPRIVEDSPRLDIKENNDLIYIESDNFLLVSEDYGLIYKEEIPIEEATIEKNDFADNTIRLLDINLLEDEDSSNTDTDNILNEDDSQASLNELRESYQEIKEFNNENRIMLEHLILNQEDIALKLNTIFEELVIINSSINNLEEALKNSKSGLKKFFS